MELSAARKNEVPAGFTLVEMLVTLAIFSVAMASLVLGLQSGIRGWRTVQAHQTRDAELRHGLDRLRGDLRRLVVLSSEEAALQESREGEKLREVVLTTLGSRLRQRAGLGSVWNRVTYTLKKGEGEFFSLNRKEEAFVAGTAMEGAVVESTLLDGLSGWQFQYGGPEGRSSSWNQAGSLPRSIEVTLERPGSRSVGTTVWIPCGAWGAPAS